MATVSKERMREVLEEAMGDVAMLMSDSLGYQDRLNQIRRSCADLWKMADLGDDLPEWETRVAARKVS